MPMQAMAKCLAHSTPGFFQDYSRTNEREASTKQAEHAGSQSITTHRAKIPG